MGNTQALGFEMHVLAIRVISIGVGWHVRYYYCVLYEELEACLGFC